MTKKVKYIVGLLLIVFLFLLWNNNSYGQVNISHYHILQLSSNDFNHLSAFHNCAWDGDDIVPEKEKAVIWREYFTIELVEKYFLIPSEGYSEWHPPKL